MRYEEIDGLGVTDEDQYEIDKILLSFKNKDLAPGNEDNHYSGDVQPIDLIEHQELGFHEANIVKYICRWKKKGGLTDLYKVAFYLSRLIRVAQSKEKTTKD